MSAAASILLRDVGSVDAGGTCVTTLLELVRAIGEETDDEREVVATVLSLLGSGRVRLCGNFRDESLDALR